MCFPAIALMPQPGVDRRREALHPDGAVRNFAGEAARERASFGDQRRVRLPQTNPPGTRNPAPAQARAPGHQGAHDTSCRHAALPHRHVVQNVVGK